MASALARPGVGRRAGRPSAPARQAARAGSAQARARGGILWIAVSGILLAGVVFVNVAVLRLNLALDSAELRPREAARRDRHAPVAVLEPAALGADPGSGDQAVRALLPGPVRVRIRPPDEVKASEKQANRRIRLLLAIFVLVFAGTLARAVWLQGVHAASLGRMAERQHRESITIPAGRGTIFDRTGVQLAIGEQTTTVYADPRQVIAAAAHRRRGARAPRRRREPALRPAARSASRASSTCSGSPTRRRGRFPEEGLHRRQLVPGGEARRTRRARSARRSSATPASTTTASPGSSSSTTSARRARRASRRSSAIRSAARST